MNVGWLVSYAAVRQAPRLWTEARAAVAAGVPLVFDSGAYSVATTGIPVSLFGYTNWLRSGAKWKCAQWCASLDVVGDPNTTYRNHHSMWQAGITNAVPTLHLGSDPMWLDKYAQLGTKRVALGGITAMLRRARGQTDEDVRRWLDIVLPRCSDLGMVTHGFGINAERLIRGRQWDSVDATSFASGTRFRTVPIYMSGKLRNIGLSEMTEAHVAHLQRIGVNTSVLGNAFIVGKTGAAQWRELLRAGLMGVSTALHAWNPTLLTLYVSDWTQGLHVLPMMATWNTDPSSFQRVVDAHI